MAYGSTGGKNIPRPVFGRGIAPASPRASDVLFPIYISFCAAIIASRFFNWFCRAICLRA